MGNHEAALGSPGCGSGRSDSRAPGAEAPPSWCRCWDPDRAGAGARGRLPFPCSCRTGRLANPTEAFLTGLFTTRKRAHTV